MALARMDFAVRTFFYSDGAVEVGGSGLELGAERLDEADDSRRGSCLGE